MNTLLSILERLRPGHKAWFWLSTEPLDNVPMLLLASFTEKNPLKKLEERINAISRPLGSLSVRGLVFVSHERQLSFGAPGLSQDMLITLANWVQENIAENSNLSILKNCTFTDIDGQGIVRAQYHTAELWKDIPDPPQQREVDRSVITLEKLPKKKTCWFWACNAGLGEAPILAIRSSSKDPKGERFSQTVRNLRHQSQHDASMISGSVFKNSNGTLVFSSTENIDQATTIFNNLIEKEPDLRSFLEGAQIAQVSDSGVENFIRIGQQRETSTSAQGNLLGELDADTTLYFWLSEMDADQNPSLLLASEKSTIKSLAEAQPAHGRILRGTLELSSQGWCHFQSAKDCPWFLSSLAQWVDLNPEPGTARLRFARLSCKDKSGTVLGRYKNDALWSEER